MTGGSSTVAAVRWSVEWEALDDMQDFVSRYCRRRWPSELAERACMSACELLENAVRYATAGSEIGLEVRDTRAGFEIRVTNEAVDSRVALLRRRVQELAAGNTADAYRKALRRLLTDSGDASAAGGLGLLRIRHEASVEVALEVQGRRVSVIATGAGSEWSARRDSHASGEHKTVKEGHGRLRGG